MADFHVTSPANTGIDDRIVLGLDLGGTHVKGVAFTASGRVLAEETKPTGDRGDDTWRENVIAVCTALRARHPDAICAGLCAPGLASRDERAILTMPGRLEGLERLVWSDALGLPTVVLNDAHSALLGEIWQGAARGADNVLMITLGTGVGGAAQVDGRLLRGHLGRAGHVGHISLNPDAAPDIVGTPGSLEDAIGECTLAARSGGRFTRTQELLDAASADDAGAAAVWDRSLRALAAAIAGLINVLDPEIVVIGGGIAAAGERLFAPLRTQLERFEWRIGDAPVTIIPAQLGPLAGAYGAAWRALQTFSHA